MAGDEAWTGSRISCRSNRARGAVTGGRKAGRGVQGPLTGGGAKTFQSPALLSGPLHGEGSMSPRGRRQAMLVGVPDGLGAVAGTGFGEDPVDVYLTVALLR